MFATWRLLVKAWESTPDRPGQESFTRVKVSFAPWIRHVYEPLIFVAPLQARKPARSWNVTLLPTILIVPATTTPPFRVTL